MKIKLPKQLLIIPPVVLGFMVLAFVVSRKEGPKRKPLVEVSTAARVLKVARQQVRSQAIGYGTVEPGQVWDAVAEVSGKIVAVAPELEVGVLLQKGTVLAKIDPKEQELAIMRIESQVHQALAGLNQTKSEEQNLRHSLVIESKALSLAESDLKRNLKLLESNAISETLMDQIERDVLRQRLQVQSLKNSLSLMPSRIAQAESQYKVTGVQLQEAKRQLEKTEIVVPYDCRVAQKNIVVGEAVRVGSVLAVADSLDRADIKAQLTIEQFRPLMTTHIKIKDVALNGAELVRRMGIGAKVLIHSDDRTYEWDATFTRIDATIDPKTRTVGIIVSVDDPYIKAETGVHPALVKGLFCEVVFTGAAIEGIPIPREAIHEGKVYLLNGENRLTIKDVDVAHYQNGIAIVTHGLNDGDVMVLSDLVPAIEGMLIEPQEDAQVKNMIAQEVQGGAR